ncbi:hypothetical protein JCM30471_36060 [Desulfuromonas carbonis]|uniref:hypothetical protein n=1 Tax=Desulfuromonas sp. DDH964 TaxID=1823759 RepID=UPI00078D2D30|nr:hypothetical protein [Desulfuromonas sp. DDH964]AMV72962.1 hypothetical protein DBW_2638 [Desulfuromonas sp. DDH964]
MDRRLFLVLLITFFLLLPQLTLAVETESLPPATEVATDAEPRLPGTGSLTAFHTYFSHNVEGLSRQVDSFFGANRVYEEGTGTYIQLRGFTTYGKGGELDSNGRVRARIGLPNLEEKVNLLLESEEPDPGAEGETLTTGNSLAKNLGDQSLATSLQYILEQRQFWDIRLQPGIKLHWPPDPFVRLRLRWLHPLSRTWLSRVTLTPGWYSSRGWDARLRYDLERSTGRNALFRASSTLYWTDDQPRNPEWSEVLFFAHPLGDRVQMAYEVGVVGDVQPKVEDNRYFASLRYRRNIHLGWVFFELQPQLEFSRTDDFRANPSLVLTLEILFGEGYL